MSTVVPGAPPPSDVSPEEHERAIQAEANRIDAVFRAFGVGGLFPLGFPRLTQEPEQQRILTTLVQNLVRVRSETQNVLQQRVAETFAAQLEVSQAEAQRVEGEATRTGASGRVSEWVPIADALLQTIYRTVREEDFRALMQGLPASIQRPLAGPDARFWEGGFALPPPPAAPTDAGTVRINLQNESWGSYTELRRRLLNRRPDEVGVTFTMTTGTSPARLTDDVVNAILNSQCDIVDQQLRGDVELPDVPATGFRTIANLSLLFQAHPDWASHNQAILNADLAGLTDDESRRFFPGVNTTTGQEYVVGSVGADWNTVTTRLYTELSRPVAGGLGVRGTRLDAALSNREPISQLYASAAGTRELMLAFATLQRHPDALDAIRGGGGKEAEVNRQLDENRQLLNAASAVEGVGSITVPRFSEQQVNDGTAAMSAVMANAENGLNSTTDGAPIPITGGLTPAQTARLGDAPGGFRATINRRYTGGYGGRNNDSDYQRVIDRAQEMIGKYEEARQAIDAIVPVLESITISLRGRGIQATSLGAGYPSLGRYLTAGGAFVVQRNEIGRDFNRPQVVSEFRESLARANPDRAVILQDTAFYQTKQTELMTQLTAAIQDRNKDVPTGSEGCWKIIEAGLKRELSGLRGPELEKTLEYMRARMEASPETQSLVRSLTNGAFRYDGESNWSARGEWNEGKSHWNTGNVAKWPVLGAAGGAALALATVGTGGLALPVAAGVGAAVGLGRSAYNWYRGYGAKTNPLGAYQKNVFERVVGLGLNENPHRKNFNELTDAYFRVKHLMSLPASGDPPGLPESVPIVQFLRRVHGAILEKVQRGEGVEMMAALSGAPGGAATRLSLKERLLLVHNRVLLRSAKDHLSEDEKARITEDAKRAYSPIKKDIEKNDRAKARLGKVGGGAATGVGAVGKYGIAAPLYYGVWRPVRFVAYDAPAAVIRGGIATTKAAAAPVGWGVGGAGVATFLTTGGALTAATLGAALPFIAVGGGIGLAYGILRKMRGGRSH